MFIKCIKLGKFNSINSPMEEKMNTDLPYSKKTTNLPNNPMPTQKTNSS